MTIRDPSATYLEYRSPNDVGYKNVILAELGRNDVRLKSLFGAVSRGTERLVYQGLVPQSEWERMRVPFQTGSFDFPLSYGYSIVAEIIEVGAEVANDMIGRHVFLLHPHQDEMVVPFDAVNLLPEHLTARRAVLAPNMETALNAVWDAEPEADQKIAIIGGGVVGLLVAHALTCAGFNSVCLIDTNLARERFAVRFGLAFSPPDEICEKYDLIFHVSGSENGLQTALNLAAFETTIIEMSWFGNKPVSLELGGAFHSQRLTIKCSQVGSVAPSKRQSHGYKDRLQDAMKLLNDEKLDDLLEPDCAFEDLVDFFPTFFSANYNGLCQVISYQPEQNKQ